VNRLSSSGLSFFAWFTFLSSFYHLAQPFRKPLYNTE
jgi:hypothetical protein